MSLDPTINVAQAGIAVACGVTAAVMHLMTVWTGDTVPPRRQLLAATGSTFLVGFVVALLLDRQHFITVDLLWALAIAGVVGAQLGPRGIRWLFAGGLAVLRVAAPAFKPPKEDPDA